jgi:hypothetical protein
MAIEDLTNQMKLLKEHGAPDLEMSEAVRDQHIGLIQDCRNELRSQLIKAGWLADIYYAGGYDSAELARSKLMGCVSGLDGILAILDKYLTYLDEFEAMVNASFNRIQAADQA